jgi:hypothetical protein
MSERGFSDEDLFDMFDYDDATGQLLWKIKPNNGVKIGDVVGTPVEGYLRTIIQGVKIQVHRIIWVIHYGTIPEGYQIDHIDGDRANNRLTNLRLSTPSQNSQNRYRVSGTSGYKGVTFNKNSQMWYAQIQMHGRRKHIGRFNTPEEAAVAYEEYAVKLHGEFFNNKIAKEDTC